MLQWVDLLFLKCMTPSILNRVDRKSKKLITSLRPVAYFVALAMMHNRDDAEEIAQETCLKASSAVAEGRSLDKGWFAKTAQRESLKMQKLLPKSKQLKKIPDVVKLLQTYEALLLLNEVEQELVECSFAHVPARELEAEFGKSSERIVGAMRRAQKQLQKLLSNKELSVYEFVVKR